jgi:hypothetical protein
MTAIAAQEIAQPYESEAATPQLSTLTLTAVATGSTHTFAVGSRGSLLVVENTNATTAVTITIDSTNDPFGRTADIEAFSVAAGAKVVRKFLPQGWEASSGAGVVNFTVSASGLEVGCIAL